MGHNHFEAHHHRVNSCDENAVRTSMSARVVFAGWPNEAYGGDHAQDWAPHHPP